MTNTPAIRVLDGSRAALDDAYSLNESIGVTSTPFDLAARRAGTQTLLRGLAILEQMPLAAVARPHLEALAEATHDTIHLGVRDGDDVLYIDKIPGTRGLEMRLRVRHRMALAVRGYAARAGRRQFQARQPAGDERVLAAHGPLRGRRLHVRPRGERGVDPLRGHADPRRIRRDRRSRVGREHDSVMPHDRMDELIPLVQCEARAISAELGWSQPQGTHRIKR